MKFPECQRVTSYASPSSIQIRTEEELRTLRAKGLRYEDVAELLDRSVPAVCKKMNGESDFYLYELHKMCSSYGLDLDAFI